MRALNLFTFVTLIVTIISGIACGSQFQELITLVYQQETSNESILCVQSAEKLQTFEQMHKIGTIVCEQYKYAEKVDAKTLGAAYRKAGWNNSIAYPMYDEVDYWSQISGTLHTGAGVSFATWVDDTKNGTIDVVNVIWKGDGITGRTKYYINLFEDRQTGEKRVLVKMPVKEIEWNCATG